MTQLVGCKTADHVMYVHNAFNTIITKFLKNQAPLSLIKGPRFKSSLLKKLCVSKFCVSAVVKRYLSLTRGC